MKKIKYIALGAFATLLSSCGNDWLDLQSSTAIETDGSLTELRDFEFVLNGAYSSMQSSSYYGADMFCYGDLRGDDMKSYKSSSTNVSFYTFKYNKTNGPSGFWGMYYGIGKNLNILFRDIEKIKLVPDREITTPKLEKLTEQEYYNDLKGEALAIRALLLFDMTRIYGYPYLKDNGASLAVPIIDKVVEDKNIKPSRNTTAQCYKAITDDLTDAVKLLRPVKKEGKINKWGAMTLLSRVYLYMGNDKEAYDVAAEAIKGAEKQGYKLWTNDEYAKIWATPFNSELLFEIVNLTTDSPGKSSIGYLSTKYNLIATEKYWKDYMKDNSDDVRSQMVSTASSSKPYCLKYPAQGSKSYEDANIPVFRLSVIGGIILLFVFKNYAEHLPKTLAAQTEENELILEDGEAAEESDADADVEETDAAAAEDSEEPAEEAEETAAPPQDISAEGDTADNENTDDEDKKE